MIEESARYTDEETFGFRVETPADEVPFHIPRD